ncbi:MAG: response regulator [Planctomycetes bacterium]|nr:response regulator [Planctomycetota bacterium]
MDSAPVPGRKALLILPESDENAPLRAALERLAAVATVADLEAALAAAVADHFDWVLGPASWLGEASQIATRVALAAVLDAIDQAVCILDVEGQLIWSNAGHNALPEQVRERIRSLCTETYGAATDDASRRRTRSISLTTEDDRYFEATITPLAKEGQPTDRLVVVVTEVTRARRLQKKMDAIDKAGRELVRFDAEQLQKLNLRQRLDLLEQKIVRYTRELLNYDNFCIRLLHKDTNKLEIVLCAGMPPEAQQIDIYCSTENSGISGYVAATGRSYICPDVRNDPRYLRGINEARSSLTVPLYLHDQVIGTFNIEARTPGAFTEDDRQFTEIFGRYIAIALRMFEVLVVERRETTGRLVDNVLNEIAAPLADILCDASTLIEDYIGHDDLRHRLQAIIDNVAKIKESVKQVTKPEGGILGARPRVPSADPLLAAKRVLVIDDEQTIRETVRDVLAKYGCSVDTARDGEEATALIGQRAYDLVLTDIRMPGKTGYEVFRAVRELRPCCPVIFMTGFGYDPSHSIIRAEPEGLSAVLFKPFKVDELLKEVRAAVTEAEAKKK